MNDKCWEEKEKVIRDEYRLKAVFFLKRKEKKTEVNIKEKRSRDDRRPTSVGIHSNKLPPLFIR